MKCSICGRISATPTHVDCVEKRRMGMECNDKKAVVEKISLDNVEMGSEIRALLNYMKRKDI